MIFCLIITVILVACNEDNSHMEDTTESTSESLYEESSILSTMATDTTLIETTEKIFEESSEESSEILTDEGSEITTVETTTENQSEETSESLGVSISDLSEEMQYLFSENKVTNDTLFFIDKGDEKRLLYPATKIISVTSYDGSVTYKEDVDYILTDDGKLKITENSSIPCITSEKYYNHPETMLQIEHKGEKKWVYWGEGDAMTKWQVCVSYEHKSVWDGFLQECHKDQFEGIIEKLKGGEDITVVFYGDSITCGANSSWYIGHNPYQYSYPMLFVNSLADLFDYTVNYVDVSHLDSLIKPTPEPYIAGERGTITYINPSMGGWTARDGVNNFNTYIKPYIEQYGCDLLVVAFAGNDAVAGYTPTLVANNYSEIIEKAKKICPELHFMMVSSMVNTPLSTNGWNTPSMLEHEGQFKIASKRQNIANKTPGAVVNMTSMSMSLLDYKEFADYSGNNINHPNDFLHRIYAQSLLQCFIGYENIK